MSVLSERVGARRRSWLAGVCCLATGAVLAVGSPVRGQAAREELHLTIGSGQVRDFNVQLPPDLPDLLVELSPLSTLDGGARPEDVLVGFARADEPRPGRWPEAPPGRRIEMPTGAPLQLRAVARRCSATGSYRASLRLRPADSPGRSLVTIPVRLEVQHQGPCTRLYVGAGTAALVPLLLGLTSFCTWSMWRRSRFLSLDALARKLRPQSWQETGLPQLNAVAGAEAAARIRRAVPWRQRLTAWLVTWGRRLQNRPWLALAGGEPYQERIKVGLANDHHLLALQPIPGEELADGLAAPGQGTLYAVATADGRVRFVAHTDADGKVGYLDLEPAPPLRWEEVELPPGTQVLSRASFESDRTGPAGWRLG